MSPVITGAAVVEMADLAGEVHVDHPPRLHRAASPRRPAPVPRYGSASRRAAACRLVRCAKTWALGHGRAYAVPDDVKGLVVPVLGHRMLLAADAAFAGAQVEDVTRNLLADIAAPTGI